MCFGLCVEFNFVLLMFYYIRVLNNKKVAV